MLKIIPIRVMFCFKIYSILKDVAEIIRDKWLGELKVDRDDVCLHFLFHLTDGERLPEILPLLNDINCRLH